LKLNPSLLDGRFRGEIFLVSSLREGKIFAKSTPRDEMIRSSVSKLVLLN
jgi:hypothetical protein